MKTFTATRVRIYPTPDQEVAFAKIAGCCRLLYNLGLEQRRDHWRNYKVRTGKTISWYDQKKEIKALKAVAPFLAEAPNHCLQEALRNLHTAYTRFFEGVSGYPKPRKKFDNDSFTFPDPAQIKMKLAEGLLHLPKFMGPDRRGVTRKDDNGPIRALFHRKIKGDLRSITISRSGTQWYASILMGVEVGEPRPREPSAFNSTGLDRGVHVPCATAQGQMLGYIIETGRMMEREKRLRRAIARCIPGSANRRKAKRKLANHKAKMARRRADMIHQITSHLVKNHDMIAIEKLAVQSMTASAKGTLEEPGRNVAQKAGLNRAILDKGWGELRRQLIYKLARKGGILIEVPAAYSSQECAACHHIDSDNRQKQVFLCSSCGNFDHADTNAAKVIRQRALIQLGITPPVIDANPYCAEGMVAPAPGELCGGAFAPQGISWIGEENGRPASGNEPEKVMA